MAKRIVKEEPILVGSKFDLASLVIDDINKKFKGGVPPASYLHDPTAATHVKNWISTGCDTLDLAISNRPKGGVPEGKVIEIFGDSGSSKSALAATILANTQKQGGLAVLIDTESAATDQFFEALGLDTSKLLYIQLEAIEEVYDAVEVIIERARKAGKDKPVTIVIDSIMGASTKMELEATYDRAGYATGKSIINSLAMRKITNLLARERITLIGINQVRANLNAGFGGDPNTTSGGKAWAFHSSVRIKLKTMGQIKAKNDQGVEAVMGRKIRAQVIKNRLGPPLRQADYDIWFNSGIDNYGSWIYYLIDNGILVKDGHSVVYTYVDSDTGEEISTKFKASEFEKLIKSNPDLKEIIYANICNSFIMNYKTANVEIDLDSVFIDDNVISED